MKYLKKEQNFKKTFESFLGSNKYDGYENVSKPSNEVDQKTKSRILDVANFDKWLAEDYTYGGYSHGAPGIVGRIDKLSGAMVVAYFIDQGVECNDNEIQNFQEKIRNNWNSKK